MDPFVYVINTFKLWFYKSDALDYIYEEVSWVETLIFIFALNTTFLIFEYLFIHKIFVTGILDNLKAMKFIISVLLFPIILLLIYSIMHMLLKMFGGSGKLTETIKYGISLFIFPIIIYNLIRLSWPFLLPKILNWKIYIFIINHPGFFSGLFAMLVVCFIGWYVSITIFVNSTLHYISKNLAVAALLGIPMLIGIILLISYQFWLNEYIKSDDLDILTKTEISGKLNNMNPDPFRVDEIKIIGENKVQMTVRNNLAEGIILTPVSRVEHCYIDSHTLVQSKSYNLIELSNCNLTAGNRYNVTLVSSTKQRYIFDNILLKTE